MNLRASTLILRLLTVACAGVAAGSIPACVFSPVCAGEPGWQASTGVPTTTMSDLHALTRLEDFEEDRSWDYLLVGGSGTIVVLGTTFDDSSSSKFAEVFQFGTVTLRAVTQINNEWWIVGDSGLAAFSINRGVTWTSVVLGTTANLRDLIVFDDTMIIVGDGVVFVRRVDGTWIEAMPTDDSWGELRAVHAHEGRLYAVGLGGAVWSTDDPGVEWVRESVDTSADLFALGVSDAGKIELVGADGAMFRSPGDGSWSVVDTGLDADFVDYSGGAVLTAEGQVFDLGDPASPVDRGRYEGARSMRYSSLDMLEIVGDGGMMSTSRYSDC